MSNPEASRPDKPCMACKKSKVKCDYTSPCSRCVRKSISCAYAVNTDGRIRKYHKRSTAGCLCCKTRHVRCDEKRPACGNCIVRAEDCIYPPAQVKGATRSRTRSTSPNARESSIATGFHLDENLASRRDQIESADRLGSRNINSMGSTAEPFAFVPQATPLSYHHPQTAFPSFSHVTDPLMGRSTGNQQIAPHAEFSPPNAVQSYETTIQLYGQPTLRSDTVPYSQPRQVSGPSNHQYNQPLVHGPIFGLDFPQDDARFSLLDDETANASPNRGQDEKDDSGTTVLPILSRNLFATSKTSEAKAYKMPQYVGSPFFSAGMTAGQTSHQAWMKSLWMNGDLVRTPKMMRTIDVDNLEGFFPNTEQRHQFKHFTTHTCNIILTIPTTAILNPWLNLFVPLALSYPHGTSLTCDAFRLGILSLATFDIGFRMAQAKDDETGGSKEADNAMYELSRIQRGKALELLKIAKIAGHLEPEKAESVEMDMTLGAALMLSIRDRLAGATEWKDPMDLAVRLVLSMGGPNTFLNKRYSPERKFILEQTVCVEIIACLTVLTPTRLLGRDQAWFKSPLRADETGHDHIELVYGLDRDTLAYIAEGLYLSDIKRSVEILRIKAKEMKGYPEFHKALLSRESEMQVIGQGLLEKVGVLRMSTLMTPHATRVVVGNLLFQAFMELWIVAEIVEDPFNSPRVQGAVDTIFEIVTEAMTRGMFSGFLLPCSWAATFATTKESRERSRRILDLLKPSYHLDYDLTTRLIRTIWTKFDIDDGKSWTNCGPATGNSLSMGQDIGGQLMDYENWERFMKEEGLYVPIF